ncbi:hypothetical protein HALLA_14925 [Halostagnicola larsenii XH-48]|uniref:Uncharacterized protein n=1 Tax=Halostagnicola larsenii XH-48 TaxID=797299 RepID=W0JQQ1_9EURY|nr:Hsp20/alpha crystallin family protein [Halostagnicola larsenii]AHG01061.1 hypothetical protein HALLA_14925 [Halostagnicola larsenii XH-48]
MSDEPPSDDERPDESSDDHRESQPDEADDPHDGEPSLPDERRPPIGPESTDDWSSAEPTGADDPEDGHWLSSLLNLLDSLDRTASASGSGRAGGRSRFGLEYDVSIGSGLDPTGSDSARRSSNRPSRISRGDAARRDTAEERPSRTRRRRSSLSTHRVTTRTYDDELLVIADVSGVDPETVTVGFDGSDDDPTLVVGVGDRELERVDVPWDRSSVEAGARIKNGVLTVTVSTSHRDGATDTASEGSSATEHDDESGGDRRE